MGFPISAETIAETAREVGETTIISRTGGAPTLAVGMAHVFAGALGGSGMKAFWYHFAILFEALFILTAVDAGTRAGRFMLQDLIGTAVPSFRATSSWVPAITATGIVVGLWGFFLYQGVTDPLGGINTLWPLFGMANQMLAAIALTLATVVFFKMKRERFAWITAIPTVWLVICTMSAGWAKLFSDDPAIGFNAHARRFSSALERSEILAPAKSLEQMGQVVGNDHINAAMCLVFMAVVVAIVGFGIRASLRALRAERWTAIELPLAVGE
jgi:carbon starvation protein